MPPSLSIGLPLLSVVGDSFDQGIVVKEGGNVTVKLTRDLDFLRERNKEAFGVEGDTIGTAWSQKNSEAIYEDLTFYNFKDYSWLDGHIKEGYQISGGSSVKSYINGLGIKVTPNSGGRLLPNKKRITKRHVRDYEITQEEQNGFENGKTVTITTDWVPLINGNGAFGASGDFLRQNVCVYRWTPNISGYRKMYFLFGVASGFENKERVLIGDQMEWGPKNKFVETNKDVCEYFDKHWSPHGLTLTVPLEYNNGPVGTLKPSSVFTIGGAHGAPVYWAPDRGNHFGVLLGVVLQKGDLNGEGWKTVTKGDNPKIDWSKANIELNKAGVEDRDGWPALIGITFKKNTGEKDKWYHLEAWRETATAKWEKNGS